MRAILAVACLAAVALAGCSSADTTHVCAAVPGAGTTLDLSTVPGSDADGFDPESACPQPVSPTLRLVAPASVVAHFPATFEWTVLNGSYAHGHAMLSALKGSHHAIGNGSAAVEDYVFEYKRVEHQEVPQSFSARLTFTEPRTLWLRAFANVRGDGLAEATFWSPELKLTVQPVPPTGQTNDVAIPQGFPLAAKAPEVSSFRLGDALTFTNKDAVAHTVAFRSVPGGFAKPADATLDAGASTPALLLDVPGTYTIAIGSTGGADALSQEIQVGIQPPDSGPAPCDPQC